MSVESARRLSGDMPQHRAMKAVRLVQPGHALELQQLAMPVVGPADALVRVRAAGICHSDAHYRAGKSRVHPLPLTLGHEVAGVVESVGEQVEQFRSGDRVCLHYLATCGRCAWCQQGHEQFCPAGAMIGKNRDGGFAEYILMPAASLVRLPEEISFAHGAIMMCSSATSLHALRQARFQPGESAAIFGIGGLGISAVQLARALGASQVFAIDLQPPKLELARSFGAVPLNPTDEDPVQAIHRLTDGRGVDVALELIGLPLTMRQAVRCLAIRGRAALAGITDKSFEIAPYAELLNREAEVIGVSDHLARELPLLLDWARKGTLDLSRAITRTVPLAADAINAALDELEQFGPDVRVVVEP